MVAKTGYFSYKDVRQVLYNFDCNKVNQLKQIHPRKYADLICSPVFPKGHFWSPFNGDDLVAMNHLLRNLTERPNTAAPEFPKGRFWSPLNADDLLVMNKLLRFLSEAPIKQGNHVTKLPLEITDHILKLYLQSTPLVCELWRIYIGTPGVRASCKKQFSAEQELDQDKIPDLCRGNQSLNEASKILLIIYGKKPLKREDPLSYFKQLLDYVFEDYFNQLDYNGKRRVLEKFSHVLPVHELEQILKITQDPKRKLQKLNEISFEIKKNVGFFEYLSVRRKFLICYFFLIKGYAAANLVVFCLLSLAFLAVFTVGVTLLIYRYIITGLFVIGFGFPLSSVCCLFIFDKYSEPELPPSAVRPLEEMIDKFVREQLIKTVDRQLPVLCEKWERVVLDLMPYVSHVQKFAEASFLY